MVEQLSILPPLQDGEDVEELIELMQRMEKYRKKKRNWENAFQQWSNKVSQDGTNSLGICGYGAMCDYCEDNSYGRPCVRALNEWCRENHKTIDYNIRDYKKVWRGEVE